MDCKHVNYRFHIDIPAMCPQNITTFLLLAVIALALKRIQFAFATRPSHSKNPDFFNIGGVLSNSQSEKAFNETIDVSLFGDLWLKSRSEAAFKSDKQEDA